MSVAVCITSFAHVEGVVERYGGADGYGLGVGLVFNVVFGWGRGFLMWDVGRC